MSLELKINGQVKVFDGDVPATLAELLSKMDIDEATVVAEIDSQIIPRGDFGQTSLHTGQNIELVRFVGGG